MTRSLLAAVLATSLLAACSSDDTTTPPPAALTCADLCTAVTAACTVTGTGGTIQFTDAAQCNAWCGTAYGWTAGTAGATSGNTIACRVTHAGLAVTPGPATTHCPHAGPTGGGACGTLCENYCDAAVRNCTGANTTFADRATCITACTTATTGATPAVPTNGAVNAPGGNSIQCRIWHLAQAQGNPGLHCPHTQIVSSSTIGGTANGPCN